MIELSLSNGTATVGVAGDTLNTAIYLKRSAPALKVDYVTRLGDDPFSGRIRDFIMQEGIGTEAISVEPGGSPGLYAITLGAGGERSFTYWRSASAARKLFSDGNLSVLDDYDLVYLSGISLAILPQEVRTALLDHIRRRGLAMAYDNNYRPGLWESRDTARMVSGAFLTAAAIPLPSMDDEVALSGESPAAVERRCRALAGLGALKRGAEGPMSIGEPIVQDYPPALRVIDTTAAGDSFNGGYLAARLTGASQARALRAGHRLAARVIGHRGAIMPADAA